MPFKFGVQLLNTSAEDKRKMFILYTDFSRKSLHLKTLLVLIGVLVGGEGVAWSQSVEITSPTQGQCVSNPPPANYDPVNQPLNLIEINGVLANNDGIINGNNTDGHPVPISVDLTGIEVGEWALNIEAGGVIPSFPQPPQPSCLDLNDCNQYFCNTDPSLCGDQGICLFTCEQAMPWRCMACAVPRVPMNEKPSACSRSSTGITPALSSSRTLTKIMPCCGS